MYRVYSTSLKGLNNAELVKGFEEMGCKDLNDVFKLPFGALIHQRFVVRNWDDFSRACVLYFIRYRQQHPGVIGPAPVAEDDYAY